ncbi:uncharacterized protein [Dermacentor albipictus]|uniref:uncharacterized protein n=1 Tax=Dermacentor albipictus TaxID=60249 RepID=UPI0038FD30D5
MDDDVTAAPEDRDKSVSATDALHYLRKLRIFIAKSGTATEGVHKNADGLESFVLQSLCCARQKTITDYLKKMCLVCRSRVHCVRNEFKEVPFQRALDKNMEDCQAIAAPTSRRIPASEEV